MTKNSSSPSRIASAEASSSGSNSQGATAVKDESATPVWSPTMGLIVAIVAAFFAGLFVGQELLHRPQIVEAPAAAMAPAGSMAGAPGSAGSADSAAGAAHNDAMVKDAIAAAKDPQKLIKIGDFLSDEQRPEYRPDLAALAYGRAIQLGAHSPSIYRQLAKADLGANDIDGAEKNLRTSIRLDPKDASAHFGLGYLLEKGHHDKAGARKEFQAALDLHPSSDIQSHIKAELANL